MLETLEARTSMPAITLVEPAPTPEQLERILRVGLTAPDHASMRPWRFITIQGDARNKLGDVFATVIVATITADHPKTPEIEQILSAGSATTLIQLAATASGFGSIWLSGPNTYHPDVKAALGVTPTDHIVGFVYMGTPAKPAAPKPRPMLADHLSEWQAPLN